MDDTDAGSTSLGSVDNIFMGHNTGGGTWANAASNYNVGIGNYVMDGALNEALHNTAGHNAGKVKLNNNRGCKCCCWS